MKFLKVLALLPAIVAATPETSLRGGDRELKKDRNPNAPPIAPAIMVTGGKNPGTCYESVLLNDLNPARGRFQPLSPGNPPTTPYGPGDPEYVGGRWNFNDGERYFLCPLTKEVPCP